MCCSSRHGGERHAIGSETYPHDATRYCKCLGVDSGHTDDPANLGKCCGAASGDDGLCDRCRTTCNKEPADGAADVTVVGEHGESAFPQSVALTGA